MLDHNKESLECIVALYVRLILNQTAGQKQNLKLLDFASFAVSQTHKFKLFSSQIRDDLFELVGKVLKKASS